MKDWFPLTRPDYLLQAEGLVALVAVCLAYSHLYPGKWALFALLFLVPDVSLLGYLGAKNAGSSRPVATAFYNVLHSYVPPLMQLVLAWTYHSTLNGEVALIWLAHISFDRLLGYGLKLPASFKHTHIQRAAPM
jgi:hypothetical protein